MGLVPGYTPAQDSMVIWTPSTGFLNKPGDLSAGYQLQPQVTSVYDVPGLLLSAPDCTQAAGGAFVSAACVDQALAVQQENFRRTAAYNAGTLKLPAAPTPPAPPPPKPYVAPPAPVVSKPPAPIVPPSPAGGAPLPTGSAINDNLTGGYVNSATDFLSGESSVAGFNIPTWGFLAAGAAALFFLAGRH